MVLSSLRATHCISTASTRPSQPQTSILNEQESASTQNPRIKYQTDHCIFQYFHPPDLCFVSPTSFFLSIYSSSSQTRRGQKLRASTSRFSPPSAAPHVNLCLCVYPCENTPYFLRVQALHSSCGGTSRFWVVSIGWFGRANRTILGVMLPQFLRTLSFASVCLPSYLGHLMP